MAVQKDRTILLRRALIINGAFTALVGLDLAIFSGWVDTVIGLGSPVILLIIGIGFVLWGPVLIWAGMQKNIPVMLVRIIIQGDFAWAIGSALLLAFANGMFSSIGLVLIAGAAVIVLAFGILQQLGLNKVTAGRHSSNAEAF